MGRTLSYEKSTSRPLGSCLETRAMSGMAQLPSLDLQFFVGKIRRVGQIVPKAYLSPLKSMTSKYSILNFY